MPRRLTCPDGESLVFCLLCPFFGPAFCSVGMCTRARFLFALAAWLLIIAGLAALLTRYQATHQVRKTVTPASQLLLANAVTSSALWCAGVHLQLEAQSPRLEANEQLGFQAFPSAQVPPVDVSQRLRFRLSRLLPADGSFPGSPIWRFDLPLTSFSSVMISLQPFDADSSFRLTVLRNDSGLQCWRKYDDLRRLPANCALVNSKAAPLNITLVTENAGAMFYVLFWSTTASTGHSAEARVAWNASRYMQPSALPHAGPVCRQSARPGEANTEVCTLSYSGYSDGFDRRVVVVEISPVNRTDLILRAECTTHLGNYLIFFLFLPVLFWCLVAAGLFGYEHLKRCRERRALGPESDEPAIELSTEFRPRRGLQLSQPDNQASSEASLLLRSLANYESSGGRQ